MNGRPNNSKKKSDSSYVMRRYEIPNSETGRSCTPKGDAELRISETDEEHLVVGKEF